MEIRAQDIQFVIGGEGKPTAVLLDISTWNHILDALEDAEDVALAKEALAAPNAAGGNPEKAGFITRDKAKKALERMDDKEK